MNSYNTEVKERWGDTDAYREHAEKTAGYTAEKWQAAADELGGVFLKFAKCKASGCAADSPEAQALVKELQSCITEHYYTCTNEILAGLGQMYIADQRFKENIDKHGEGTAQLVSQAIEIYSSK